MRRIRYERAGLNYNLSQSPRHCYYHQKYLFKHNFELLEEELLESNRLDRYLAIKPCGDRHCEV